MKIIFCLPFIIMGGVEKVLCQYLYEIKRLTDYEVSVLCYKKVKDKYFLNFFCENRIPLYDNFFNIKEDYSKNTLIRFIQKIQDNLLKKINNSRIYSILNKHEILIDFKNYSFTEIFSKLNKKKLSWCHGSSIFFKNVCVNTLAFHDIYDRYIFLTESLYNELDTIAPFLKERAAYIYNPINVEQLFFLSSQKCNYLIKYSNYFLAIQRIDNRDKDLETVISAFNLFTNKYNDVYLLVLGDGPEKIALEEKTHNKNIIFLGQVDNPYPLIKKSLGVILSSRKKVGEGFSNVILETQALNSLIISSDVKSCAREALLDGKAGLLFDAENPISLFETLVYRMEHKDQCANKQKKGFEEITRFAPEKSVNKLVSILQTL